MVGMRDGHRNECKRCNLDAKARRHRENPGPARERVKQWKRDNPEREAARQAAYRASGRKAVSDRKSYLKRKYGISLEHYDALLEQQGGVCAICERPPRDDISLHVDHEHGTARIRGLLCFRCNNALGDFDDDHDRLVRAVSYLGPVEKDEATVARLEALQRLRA
ncbi:MAG TPA: endonuclease VII domain-containing protein [Acidimicrobiales bacterium]|nr:endonuclease VII domain-containing protein [Acidimicrobiales bacterium]